VEALRQLQTVMPLSEAARIELEAAQNSQQPSDTGLAEVTSPLAEITRVYGRGGSPATLVDECAELQARLRAQLNVHCHVTGSWATRRNAKIAISYCGPALSELELNRMAHGVLRVMEPD
jgi:hypothetical protein